MSDLIDAGTVLGQCADLHVVELDGEAVVLDHLTNRLHLLNATATLVWSRLDGSTTLAGLAAGVAEQFGLDLDDALRDVAALGRQLVAERLADVVR